MNRILSMLTLLLLCVSAAAAPFQDGERWCAVGDSITHSGRYHDYVYLFYATRFPGRTLNFFDCGISGDTAAGTLRRVNGDILRHKPTVATIMLGMNDVGRNLYAEGAGTPEIQKRREEAIAAHAGNMKKLAERLHAAGARLIFITPSIFDDTAVMKTPNLPGVNAALGRCGEFDRQLAREFGGELVDFHGPMTALNLAQQKQDPHFSIVGEGRVHPGEAGHLVMAYLFLKAQGAPQRVADITADAAGKDAIEFTSRENALPFPVPAGCAPALRLVPFMEELNQERLCVANLPAGSYTLAIDGETIASYPAADLAKGVNLAAFANTPQYRQALAVAKLDDRRFDIMKRLRTIDYIEGKMGREIGDPTPFNYAAAAQKVIDNPRNAGWPRDRAKEYLTLKPKQAEMERQMAALVAQIRQASQPRPHRFSIRPLAPQQ